MLEEIAEGFFQAIGRVIGYLFVDFLFNIVFYYTGWLILKLVTLGRYPPKPEPYGWAPRPHSRGFVIFIGSCAWLVVLIYAIHKFS